MKQRVWFVMCLVSKVVQTMFLNCRSWLKAAVYIPFRIKNKHTNYFRVLCTINYMEKIVIKESWIIITLKIYIIKIIVYDSQRFYSNAEQLLIRLTIRRFVSCYFCSLFFFCCFLEKRLNLVSYQTKELFKKIRNELIFQVKLLLLFRKEDWYVKLSCCEEKKRIYIKFHITLCT